MLINENGLIRAIKSAYKHSGYTVANLGEDIAIYGRSWFVQCKRAMLPRKVMATIVEHTGMIPEEQSPVLIQKDTDPQTIMEDVARDDMDHWRSGQRGDSVTIVPVTMQGYQIFQVLGGNACWGIPLMHLGLIERDIAVHASAEVIDQDRFLWQSEGEAVVVEVVRKAASNWSKTWERDIWSALESVNLHQEE